MSYVYLAATSTGQRSRSRCSAPPRRPTRARSSGCGARRPRHAARPPQRLPHPPARRTADGLIYLVMPFLQGELLPDRTIRHGPAARSPTGCRSCCQMCRGLQHAHELAIVHRDLKPENIMLVPDPALPGGTRAVVMDFGLAKERRAGPASRQAHRHRHRPRHAGVHEPGADPRASRSTRGATSTPSGILAFEMFTGQLPFEGETAQEMMIARLRGQPDPAPRGAPRTAGPASRRRSPRRWPWTRPTGSPPMAAFGEALDRRWLRLRRRPGGAARCR